MGNLNVGMYMYRLWGGRITPLQDFGAEMKGGGGHLLRGGLILRILQYMYKVGGTIVSMPSLTLLLH